MKLFEKINGWRFGVTNLVEHELEEVEQLKEQRRKSSTLT